MLAYEINLQEPQNYNLLQQASGTFGIKVEDPEWVEVTS